MSFMSAVASPENDNVLISWSDALSVGIQEIDEQHKVLVDLLNQLHTAITQRHGNAVTDEILEQLVEYTRIHFAVEESLMRILGYPDYENHKEHHKQLIEEIQGLMQRMRSKKRSVSFELLHFLKIWLTKHIMEEDKQYVPFLLSKGVKARYEKRSWMERFWGSK